MSDETLKAIKSAVLAHLKDLNPGSDLILDDVFVAYGGMVPRTDVPTGFSHFTGYLVGDDCSPQSAYGTAALGLAEMKVNLTGCSNCTHET